jgi:hypothetical protein
MDRHALALFIPILALAIPTVAIVMSGLQKVWRLRVEEARLRSGAGEPGAVEEVEALRGELEAVRRELSELHERVDFAERLLVRGRQPNE